MLGIDEQGREILTFIEGHVPPDLATWSDEQLVRAAELIRRFHDATAGSALAGGEEVVCHNDLSPCNTGSKRPWAKRGAAASGGTRSRRSHVR